MKVGIISDQKERQVPKDLELIYKAFGYEVERFSQDEFQPKYVLERSLDALLIEGRSNSDEGFAIAVRRNVPETVKMYYLFYQRIKPQDLQSYKIEALDILDENLKEKFTQWIEGA